MLTAEQLRNDFKYLFVDEVPALKRLVQSLPNKPLVVNIGAGAGTSGLAILEARSDSMLITLDIQNMSSPFGCLEAERDVIKRAGIRNSTARHWQFCLDSVEAGLGWTNEIMKEYKEDHGIGFVFKRRPDMVFVDGDHSYEHCRDDIIVWWNMLYRGTGILAVHDYQKAMFEHSPNGPHPKSWPGVDQAVDELLIGKYEEVMRVDSLIAFRKP